MKLLLINPLDNNTSLNPRLNDYIGRHADTFIVRHPSLPLLTIAGLTPSDIDVEYQDENVREIDLETDADLIGITSMTQQATRAYEIAGEFKKRGKRVVIGGIHATVLPGEVKKHADAVVTGEAENIWGELLADLRRGKLKDIYRGGLTDIKRSPVPRYDLLASYDFSRSLMPLIPTQVSRGCPHDCAFCSVTSVYGSKYRTKPVGHIVREIEAIFEHCRLPNMIVKFNDDNPFIKTGHAKKMLKAIEHFKMRWFALADISVASDKELLKLLRRSGCVSLGIGFESMNPEVLSDISHWKRKYLERYASSIRAIQEEGITVAGSFMFGFDHDSPDSFSRVRDFVLEQNVVSKFSIVTPFPGTRLYAELEREGRIKDGLEWKNFNFLNVVYKTKMPEEELIGNLVRLYEETWNKDVIAKIQRYNTDVLKRS